MQEREVPSGGPPDTTPISPAQTASGVTELLQAWGSGDADALDRLIPLVYSELHRQAERYLRREEPGHTLQTTALVHEAYLRLVDQRTARWESRTQFFGVAAQIMRRILVDHARKHNATKRGGSVIQIPLEEETAETQGRDVSLVALDEALVRLAEVDERQARVVELRFFTGLGLDETAQILGISPATAKRDWAMARAWLRIELEAA